MDILSYNDLGELELDGTRLQSFVKDEQEPTYVYSSRSILNRIDLFKKSLSQKLEQRHQVHYAVKANSHPGILKLMHAQGFGADVVSFGEMKKWLQAGLPAHQVIFSGAGKTKEEIRGALDAGVKQLNVESVPELKRIAELSLGKKASVSLRVNPAVDPKTHPYISTGFKENKFGINEEAIGECLEVIRKNPQLQLVGISSHIGSQLLEFDAVSQALRKKRQLFLELKSQGFPVTSFDAGGGLGVRYDQSSDTDEALLEGYTDTVAKELKGLEAHIQFEPGRFLVVRSGVLLTQIQYIKKTTHRNFVIVNTGMHHLVRPALYQAYHRIFPLQKRSGESFKADVVGPVCESSDFLGKERSFEGLQEGDWLAIAEAGAYGYSMVSLYNAFTLPKEILF